MTLFRITQRCAAFALFFTASAAAQALPESRDTSSPERKVNVSIGLPELWVNAGHTQPDQPAVKIHFSAAAAPPEKVGKALPAGQIRMDPAVPGEWSWEKEHSLVFRPTTGWLPPNYYTFQAESGLLDAKVTLGTTDFGKRIRSIPLNATFSNRDYYIDPATPQLQQLTTSVTFNYPVAEEELHKHLNIRSATDSAIFEPGSKLQIIPTKDNACRFYLRSPALRPSEKEDLVVFEIASGLTSKLGGLPTEKPLLTKLTCYSKYSLYAYRSAAAKLLKTATGQPQQALMVDLTLPANSAEAAKAVQAFRLPPLKRDKYEQLIPWRKEDLTEEFLKTCQPLSFKLKQEDGDAPLQRVFLLECPPQEGGLICLKVAKDTPGPGGFVTPEDFVAFLTLPAIPREIDLLGNGGLLALNGERKLTVRSRGLDTLRYSIARVPQGQVNHLVSQASGRFQSPNFARNFSLENISAYESQIQPILRPEKYAQNYSSFDFGPLVHAGQHGLFHMTIEAVRPRAEADGQPNEHAPEKDWVPLSLAQHSYQEDGEYDEEDYQDGHSPRSAGFYPTQDRMLEKRFVLVTDLGLILKEQADGTRYVYVQSFSRREPVSDATITVVAKNGVQLHTARTDASGRGELPSMRELFKEKAPVALLALKDTDIAFIPWQKSDRELSTSRYDVGGVAYSEKQALSASLFTERGIYRPGETMHVAGIVRQRDWAGDLTGLPLELRVFNAKNDEVGRYPVKLAAGGVFSLDVPTAETAPTGPWRMQLDRPGKNAVYLGGLTLRVEEFQPDRLKIQANFHPQVKEGWQSPEELMVAVQLDTLFGIPAANRQIKTKLRLTALRPYFSQWPGWTFGVAPEGRADSKESILPESTTNDQGQAKIALDLAAQNAPMLNASVEIEAFEADGGRGVRTGLDTLVSRQTYLLGYKAERSLDYLRPSEPTAVEVMAIGRDGRACAVPDLTRVLVHVRHVSVLTKQENGNFAYQSNKRADVIEAVPAPLAVGAQRLELPLQKPGEFRYEFRNAAGDTLCTVPFFVAGTGDAQKNLERSGELEIAFADQTWLPGQEMEFSLTAPFTGAGLVTIEKDRVLSHQWFKLDSKTATLKIQLPQGLEGGAYLHVVMCRALDSPEVFHNPLVSGIKPIRIGRQSRELALNLESPERVRPGEMLTIGLTAAKAGHAVIWAVDEGIHQVSGYTAPDPLRALLPQAGLEVQTWQLMDVLLPEFTLLRKALAIGGDGGGAPTMKLGLNPFKRRRDAPVIYWSGFVPVGRQRVQVSYRVPEYFAGRLNIMAVGVSPDAIGVAKAATIAKGDFVLTANTPLFVAPGDEFTASLTVANQLEGADITQDIRVQATSEGGLEIVQAAPEQQSIPHNQEKTVQFLCRVKEPLGNAELRFSASAGNCKQEIRSSMSIRPATPRAAVVQSGWFRNGSKDVELKQDLHTEFSERTAVVSTTPLGLAHGLSAYLKEFPHGCTEQITSRAFPWLVLQDDANFGISKEQAAKAISATMDQLSLRQASTGGFGYWYAQDEGSFDYLSIYVGHFLETARSSGFAVPERMRQSNLRRLRQMADLPVPDPGNLDYKFRYTRQLASMRAAAIYLLTRNEEVTTNYALHLQDFLEAKVPKHLWHRDTTAAWLAATWRLLKKETAAQPLLEAHRKALKAEIAKDEEWDYYYSYYASRLTQEATLLTILCRHFPEVAQKLTYEELKSLTSMVETADFSTLSAAWSVQALKAYSQLSAASGVKAGISQTDGKVLAEAATGQIKATVPAGMTRFFFAPESPEGMGAWYQTIETGFARKPPTQASAVHVQIHREYLTPDGKPAVQGKVGEPLLAKLKVTNLTTTKLPYLAIVELLPGGFEFAPPGEHESLRPGLATKPGTTYIDVREDRALMYLELAPNGSLEIRYSLRPIAAGQYTLPNAYVEDMYDAKVRSVSVGGTMLVLPRK